MKAFMRRLRRLEVGKTIERNADGLTKVDVLLNRLCRRQAQETGRAFEAILAERKTESKAFWAFYTGDRSLAGILRSRFHR